MWNFILYLWNSAQNIFHTLNDMTFTKCLNFNSGACFYVYSSSASISRQWMAFQLFRAKPLPETMMIYRQFNLKEWNSTKLQSVTFLLRKCIRECYVMIGGYLAPAPNCQVHGRLSMNHGNPMWAKRKADLVLPGKSNRGKKPSMKFDIATWTNSFCSCICITFANMD